MCSFISWCKLDPSAQAAWVQAVGSVLAILIAVAVPAVAAWSSARSEQARRRERMLNAALRVFDPISSLRVSLEEYLETLDPAYDSEPRGISTDPHDGDFQSLIPAVIASVAVLDDMGSLAPALRKFLFELIELDRFLKAIPAIQRSGSPAFWRNNIEDIRLQMKGVLDSADVVIDGMRAVMAPAPK